MSNSPSVTTYKLSEGQSRYLTPPQVTWLTAEEQYHGQHLPHTTVPTFKYRDTASLWYSEMNRLKRQIRKG